VPDCKTLVVDDFEEFRTFVVSALRERTEFQSIWQAADGLEAVQRAEDLQPDLILLDIGLPGLNGVEAARRIRKASPNSRILFVSMESSAEMVEEILRLGARGYLLKSDAHQLWAAVDEILGGGYFVSSSLRGALHKIQPEILDPRLPSDERSPLLLRPPEATHGHQVASYPNDASFVKDFIRFIEAAIKAGNPVIVIATEAHRRNLQMALEGRGWNMAAAIEEGSYIALDASDTISTFMVNDWPDSAQVVKGLKEMVASAAQAAKRQNARVAACGEMGPMLLAQGKREAAFELERLTHEVAASTRVDILCGYMLSDVQLEENRHLFERICAQHSAAYSR